MAIQDIRGHEKRCGCEYVERLRGKNERKWKDDKTCKPAEGFEERERESA